MKEWTAEQVLNTPPGTVLDARSWEAVRARLYSHSWLTASVLEVQAAYRCLELLNTRETFGLASPVDDALVVHWVLTLAYSTDAQPVTEDLLGVCVKALGLSQERWRAACRLDQNLELETDLVSRLRGRGLELLVPILLAHLVLSVEPCQLKALPHSAPMAWYPGLSVLRTKALDQAAAWVSSFPSDKRELIPGLVLHWSGGAASLMANDPRTLLEWMGES